MFYPIKADIRGSWSGERRVVRQNQIRPESDALESRLRKKLALLSRKSKLAEAIRYALSRLAGLSQFLDNGRIEVESNVIERAIRPLALNRKNALFAGLDGGGELFAMIASQIETWELIGVEPHTYLTEVITCLIEGYLQRRLDSLLPWTYPTAPALEAAA